jgi:hypothetical protein
MTQYFKYPEEVRSIAIAKALERLGNKNPGPIKSRGRDVMSSSEVLLCESLKHKQRQPQLNHKVE